MSKKQMPCLVMLLIAILLMGACGGSEEVELYYSPGNEFVTNIIDSEGVLVKAVITLGMCRDATDMLTEKNAIVRDCILHVIRSTPLADLSSADMQATLSAAIVEQLNALFPPGDGDDGKPLFTRVYFLDFVMQ